jgi:hypothetical protein
MLTEAEAAYHCGRTVKRFRLECPVAPVEFANGDVRWDVHDLDAWIDSLKHGATDSSDSILEKLR